MNVPRWPLLAAVLLATVLVLLVALITAACRKESAEDLKRRLADHELFHVLVDATELEFYCQPGDAFNSPSCTKWVASPSELESLTELIRASLAAHRWEFVRTSQGEFRSDRTLIWRNDDHWLTAAFIPRQNYSSDVPDGTRYVVVLVVAIRDG